MIKMEELNNFAKGVLKGAGASSEDATELTSILSWADQVGRTEQGVERLPILCKRLESGLMKSPAKMIWENEKGSAAALDAGDGIGHVAAQMATKKAITLAQEGGVSAVTVKNSNYFGAAGYYSWLAAKEGMVGVVMSNSFPKVAAYSGLNSVLGTNPFSFAAPVANNHPIILDMATAAVAGSEIRRRKNKGLPLDPGMAIDKEGNPLLDPNKFKEGTALPFGGARGFGIMILVEMLSGVLSGGAISKEVRSMYSDWERAGKSTHFILALNPEHFLPAGDFKERMQRLCNYLWDSGEEVRVPGQMRWDFYKKTQKEGISPANIPVDALKELGQKYQVNTDLFQS